MSRSQQQLESDAFKTRWSAVSLEAKTTSIQTRMFPLVFVMRRLFFVAIGLFIGDELLGINVGESQIAI